MEKFSMPMYRSEDQGTALSHEISRLSQTTIEANATVSPSPGTDGLPSATFNLAVEKLPQVSFVEKPTENSGGKITGYASAFADIGLGTAAIVGAEVVTGILTKNPKFEAMALQTYREGGMVALLANPQVFGRVALPSMAIFGAATATRHYSAETLTGKSESWSGSANHVAIGELAFLASRYLGRVSEPIKLPQI